MNYKVSLKGFGRNRSHRAVAPIIATLLMVAIAVVGGVMVYIFTQGFFGSTSSTAPTVDALASVGYDFRETTPVTYDDGTNAGTGIGQAATPAGSITTGEYGALYVKNGGTGKLTITKVEVSGAEFTFKSSGAIDADKQFQLWKRVGVASESQQSTASLNAGEIGTLILRFSADTGTYNGRTLSVKVSTGSGGVFNFPVVVDTKV